MDGNQPAIPAHGGRSGRPRMTTRRRRYRDKPFFRFATEQIPI